MKKITAVKSKPVKKKKVKKEVANEMRETGFDAYENWRMRMMMEVIF